MSGDSLAPAELEAIRRRERRAAAVARTAARVASERSLPATLRALALEIQQADGLAGVQVLTNEHSGDKLHMLGIAGFQASATTAFFSRLMECQRRGADLRMLEAFQTGDPVVIPHRYREIMEDPAWEPLREYHRAPEWDAFASIPIKIRKNTIGILNVFVSPGMQIDDEGFEFLLSMAEQAGLAIDYASLLEQERNAAQRAERQRLARDLHDSVVQQVFSMGMLAQTLKVLADDKDNGAPSSSADSARMREITSDLVDITGSVLKDLRGLVTQLRPSPVTGVGLNEAVEKLVSSTHRQTGVNFKVQLEEVAENLDNELAEDIYHVIAESVHNAVKHSSSDTVFIGLACGGKDMLDLQIRDSGGEHIASSDPDEWWLGEGNGLTFMRQRIERWNGRLTVEVERGLETLVRAEIPRRSSVEEHREN